MEVWWRSVLESGHFDDGNGDGNVRLRLIFGKQEDGKWLGLVQGQAHQWAFLLHSAARLFSLLR